MPSEEDINKSESGEALRTTLVWRTIALAWELGYVIALPLVVFGISGRWLDRRYDTSPLFLLVGILAAIVISGIWVFKKIAALSRENGNSSLINAKIKSQKSK